MTTILFEDDTYTPDTTPPASDVQYPCKKCGREAGPYGGRGPKPTVCADCKPRRGNSGVRTPRSNDKLAAQATSVLVQMNAMFALGISALGFFKTGREIMACNDEFESAAYNALIADEDFCRAIVRTGAKSARLSLGIAYGAMGMRVGPTMVDELRAKKAAREAKMSDDETQQFPVVS